MTTDILEDIRYRFVHECRQSVILSAQFDEWKKLTLHGQAVAAFDLMTAMLESLKRYEQESFDMEAILNRQRMQNNQLSDEIDALTSQHQNLINECREHDLRLDAFLGAFDHWMECFSNGCDKHPCDCVWLAAVGDARRAIKPEVEKI